MAAKSATELTGVSVRLQGPIDGPNLTLQRDPSNPLATTAWLESA
jgi:hypothetical protein